ncbi:MAG: hypothetical protein ACJ766_01015 [Thermoleophilaceae bacterium]|jgi:hypothetical protein
MSQLTHPRAQVFGLSSRFKAWLAVAAVAAVAAVPAVVLISNDDNSSQTQKASSATPGLRYDGGPDEGTRGLAQSQSSTQASGSDVFGRRP